MEQFFTSLSKRQTMLLLTALSFGGADAVAAFEHLLPEEEELLSHRAQGLLQIPRDRRIPLLVQEIKRLFTQRRRALAAADPARLAELLARERPAMVEVMLRALPSELADNVRQRLPGGPPKVSLQREVKPEVLSIIRWKLEEAMKKRVPQVGTFRFTDLLTFQQREVLAICDRMGARVLATAIAGLDDESRQEFLGQLPPDQRALAAKAAEAGAAKRLSTNDATLVLEMHNALANPSQGLRSAGVQRLARACVAQGPEFGIRLVERHPGDLGKLLGRWLKEERNRPVKADGGRVDIVEQMERLAQRGIIDRPMRLPPPAPPARPPAPPAAAAPVARSSTSAPRAGEPAPAGRTGTVNRLPVETIPTGVAAARPATPSAFMPTPRRAGNDADAPPEPEQGGSRVISLAGAPIPGRPAPQVARPTSSIPARREPPGERPATGTAARPSTQPPSPRGAERTDPGRPAVKRVLRDGKPLAEKVGDVSALETLPPKRATTGPVVQGIPKRRERPTSEAPSPAPPRGPGRGPGSGSR